MLCDVVECVDGQSAFRLACLFKVGAFVLGPLNVLIKVILEVCFVFALLFTLEKLSSLFVHFELAGHRYNGASGIVVRIVWFGRSSDVGWVCGIFRECSIKIAKVVIKSGIVTFKWISPTTLFHFNPLPLVLNS
jgi:hypothetical protein